MFDFIKYDFSKESSFKDALFKTMIKIFEKSQRHIIELSDDELDLVDAAGGYTDTENCPYAERRCKDCEYYERMEQKLGCARGYYKL